MLYLITFLEGIITFISPCLLPMLPIYVSYFAGGEERSAKKTLVNAVGFVLGFTTVFVLLGALAGTVGSFLKEHRTAVDIVSGALVVVFGLHYLGLFQLPFFRGRGFTASDKPLGPLSAFLFGLIFSVGWTPCVGAFLGSALSLASQQGQMGEGVLLLLVYSLGLGLPFVFSAILIDKLKSAFSFIKRHYRIINTISGCFLILVGVLMMSGLLGRFLALLA
ncbi:MAG: cytochrome c biogenesis protein CcdA [Ruminococcaceae bacterium]|nr:cytochrome c biogenesis protein CcdA [Oscillospiraceae bacterium]